MRNKALTDSVLMLCLSIVLFADQINKKENERRLLHRRESTLISTILWKLVRFNPGLFPYKMGGTWGQDCCQSEENGTGQYPVWMNPKNFQGCLFKIKVSVILRLLQHIRPHILEGFSSHNLRIMCIWSNCGKEVLHFVMQSNNVLLNKQGFW